MGNVEYSDRPEVEASTLRWTLSERAALTTAVCNELDTGQRFDNIRAKSLLAHLRRWVDETLARDSAWPDDGLDGLEVPAELQPLLNECRVGAKVCSQLVFYWDADPGTDRAADEKHLREVLAEWRLGRAAGFSSNPMPHPIAEGNTQAKNRRLLYMVEHPGLRLRKVGITTSQRLKFWLQRGWVVLDTVEYATSKELRAAEAVALCRLDQCHARRSKRMGQVFHNLDPNGRTEMFDPQCFPGTLHDLLSPELAEALHDVKRIEPMWISEPRRDAARKAHLHPGRDQSAASKKAWITIRANKEAKAQTTT